MLIGGYVGLQPGGSTEAQFAAGWQGLSAAINQPLAIMNTYIDQTQSPTGWLNNNAFAVAMWQQSPPLASVIPLISLPMASSAAGAPTAAQMFQSFLTGTYDSMITAMVEAWANAGWTTQYWRPGWEMNLKGQPWYVGNTSALQDAYIYAFRHIYSVLHAAAAAYGATLKVIWCPGIATWTGITYTANLGNIWPACGDIIGCDIYSAQYPPGVSQAQYPAWAAVTSNRIAYWNYPASPTGSTQDTSGGTSCFFTEVLKLADAYQKPFAICETGAGGAYPDHDLEDEAAFPGWLMSTLKAAPRNHPVEFVSVWDSGTSAFSTGQKPNEQAAWLAAFTQ